MIFFYEDEKFEVNIELTGRVWSDVSMEVEAVVISTDIHSSK